MIPNPIPGTNLPRLPYAGSGFEPRMDYIIPQWEERTSYGVRRIDPYAKLFEDRIIFLGTPISDDIANAVEFLCSERSGFISGAVIPVDGGWLLR